MGERITETAELTRAVEGTQGKEWEIKIIQPGVSKNGVWYTPDVLKAAASLYEGAYSYERHSAGERGLRERIGRLHSVTYDTREGEEGLWGRLRVINPTVREMLLEAADAGELNTIGFSHDVMAVAEAADYQGKKVKKTRRIEAVNSVDMVEKPSAGGRMSRLVAGDVEGDMDADEIKALIAEQMKEQMAIATASLTEAIKGAVTAPPADDKIADPPKDSEAVLAARQALKEATQERQRGAFTRAIEATKLSTPGKALLTARFEDLLSRREVEDSEIPAIIKEAVQYEAAIAGDQETRQGVGIRFEKGRTGHDKYMADLFATFAGPQEKLAEGAQPFGSFREAYIKFTGDWNPDYDTMVESWVPKGGYRSNRDHQRIQESITTASWGEVMADVMYQRLIAAYRSAPWYDQWRLLCSDIESVPDFRTRHWMRFGGYGDLPAVSEGATYQPTTSPTDEEVTYSVSKRGMLEDITWEATLNDQVGVVRRIPNELGRAASRTLYKFVMNLVTTDNPTMAYDSVALYNAAHGNTGTTALTNSGVYTTEQLMRDQTGYNQSSEILGPRNRIKYLIVPNELTGRADRILNPSDQYLYAIATPADTETVMDPAIFKGQGKVALTYDALTDATDWWAVADPNEMSTVVMGFLSGRQEPELFVQDQPQNGSNFTADKVTYKIRHVFGGVVTDHRSFFRQVVAG